jgi:predicted nucleotidyltransferase
MNNQAIERVREFAVLLRRSLGAHLIEVILFGSRARGDAWEGSDYDVIVVVDKRTPETREAVLDAEVEMMNRHETLFAALVYGQEQWQRTLQFPLGWNVTREGIAV